MSRKKYATTWKEYVDFILKEQSSNKVVIGVDKSNQKDFTLKYLIVDNFLDELIRVAKLESEPGLPKWAKLIDYIDTDFKNGFCFVGEFIGEGTVQIPIGKMRLIFVQSSITYDKHKTGKLRQFRIVKMEKDGTLHWTRIATDDSTGGWALRIRDKTKNFLSQLESIEELKENKNQDEDKPSRFSQVKL